MAKWVTVTVTGPDGRRHSLDLQASSTYDAAHLYVVEAKKERAVGLPKVTLATVFEVVTDDKVYLAVLGHGLEQPGDGLSPTSGGWMWSCAALQVAAHAVHRVTCLRGWLN